MYIDQMKVKIFQFYKRGIGIESEKIMETRQRSRKQVGDSKQVREWKQVKDEVQGLLNVERKCDWICENRP